MNLLRKYGVASTIYFPLVTAGAQDFKATPTLAAGDIMVDIDGAGFNNVDVLGGETVASSKLIAQALTAAKLTGKVITLRCVDQTATKEWEDQMLIIETYGHPSAMHPFDLSVPNKGFTNIIRTSTAQAGSTSSTLVLDASASAVDDFYNGRLVCITGGTGANQIALITDYVGSSKTATIRCLSDTGLWITTPDATSTFSIFDRDPQFAASVWKAPTSAYADAGSFAKLIEDGFSNAISELTGDPGATPTLLQAVILLYMELRNLKTVTNTAETIANSAGATILTKALADNGTTFTKSKVS